METIIMGISGIALVIFLVVSVVAIGKVISAK